MAAVIERYLITTTRCALPLLPFNDGMVGRIGALDARGWLLVLFLALFGFVLAYVLWYRGLRVLSPSQTAVYIYLVPVFGIFFAWWLLDEQIGPLLLLGGAVILAGVALTNSTRSAGGARPRAENRATAAGIASESRAVREPPTA